MIKIQIIGTELLEKIGRIAKDAKESLVVDLFRESQIFGLNAVRISKNKYLRGPRPDKIKSEGLLKTHINTETRRDGNIISTFVGSDVIYARIQELGGTTHPNLTDKMRKFAWAMFYKTKEEMWKRLALSKKDRLTIKIPARPYLRPSIEEAMPEFQGNIARVLSKINFIEGANG